MLSQIIEGWFVAIGPMNLLYVLGGALLGTTIGAFPGLSAPTAIALLLPVTFTMDPTSAIIMLAGIYYGSQFGNSISAVLLGIPGDSAAVLTALEGHRMAKAGRAGAALTIAAFASFTAGIIGVFIFALTGPALAWLGLRFGSPEYAAVMLLAFATLPAFAGSGQLRTILSVLIGLALATVGVDQFSAVSRFTFDQGFLYDGLPFVVAIIGLFGVAEILSGYSDGAVHHTPEHTRVTYRDMWPNRSEWKGFRLPTLRSSFVGFGVGILPGAGATIASFSAYALERALARNRSEFGCGSPRGLSASEAGNSGASIGAMVPLLALGMPGSPATAVLFGGFLMWGLQPGPRLFETQPVFVWALLWSMIAGNLMLLVINTLMVPWFVKISQVRFSLMAPIVVVFCAAGAFAVNNSTADVGMMLVFGVLGLSMKLLDIPIAPTILGLILGELFERHLINSLQISRNGLWIFVDRPIALTLLLIAAVFLIVPSLFARRSQRKLPTTRPAEGAQ